MRAVLVASILLLLSQVGSAWAQMYSTQELDADRARLQSRIDELHQLLTRPEYVPSGASWLADVPIRMPDVAENGDPMGFASDGQSVLMPVAGLKFIEDLTIAYAWRYQENRRLEPFDEYLAMLRWKPRSAWPGGEYLDPLEVFAVAADWRQDSSLEELSRSLRNEAWAFILAHELGHVYYRHPGNNAVPPAQSQANEREADEFALDLMDQTATIPMGAMLFFQATAAFYTSRVDLPTDEDYARWQRDEATHPVNSERLLSFAWHLQLAARREGDADRADTLRYIGNKMEEFAAGLNDPAMQQLIVRNALSERPEDLEAR